MKVLNFLTKSVIVFSVFLLAVCSPCLADKELERSEVLQIFHQLTQHPQKTWIPAGTIEANHHEYRAAKVTDPHAIASQISQKVSEYQNNPNKPERAEYLQKIKLDAIPFNVRYKLSNEYTMDSSVTVKFDGERFYWEINTNSRTDSVKPGKDLAGNDMTDHFSDLNTKRIFAWDGEKYSMYSPLANHSFVDAADKLPHGVKGPLTAGLTPWGYGHYSYDSLIAADSIGVEKSIDGQIQIHLTVNMDGIEIIFVLDPSKDYAVLSCSINGYGNAVISKQYSDYSLVSGNWVPMSMLLERVEVSSNRLLASDLWEINSIDANTPQADSFNIDYADDTLIQYACGVTGSSATYRHSIAVDTDTLLAERLVFASNQGVQVQNCATAALKYAAGKLGQTVNDNELAELVTEPNNSTSLYAIKAFVENKGLYCRAVTTDIEAMKTLNNCQVILYLPSNNHFVVLESIDNDYVKIIDLSSRRFYYRKDLSFFDMDWSTGVALLISNDVITGEFSDIEASDLQNIIGAAGYTCTRLIQEEDDVFCEYVGGYCLGDYVHYYWVYGCEVAESGSCSNSWFYRRSACPCIEDPYDPFNCIGNEDWTHSYIRACDGW